MEPSWFELARRPSVVRRALKYAVIVGAVLIAINHGEAILDGEIDFGRVVQMALTASVPYAVSTLSSVGVMKESRRDG